jgi:pre-mRNA-splicing factor RBM22/SLT11
MGNNDPVAKKILGTTETGAGLTPPADKDVTSLFLSALPPSTDESQLRTFFIQSVPGLSSQGIKSITMVPTSKCAFVNFASRGDAESAAQRCAFKMELDGKEIRVAWGRSRPGNKAVVRESAAT